MLLIVSSKHLCKLNWKADTYIIFFFFYILDPGTLVCLYFFKDYIFHCRYMYISFLVCVFFHSSHISLQVFSVILIWKIFVIVFVTNIFKCSSIYVKISNLKCFHLLCHQGFEKANIAKINITRDKSISKVYKKHN